MKSNRIDPAQLGLWASALGGGGARPSTTSPPTMSVVCLQSGSSGNCTYVETKDARILVDAGISATQVDRRLRALGKDPNSLDALLISHDHSDHARHMGVIHRKFGVPIYATPGCMESSRRGADLGPLGDVRVFKPGQCIELGAMRIRSIPTPHDANEGVVFVITAGGKRLGILTDLGHVFDDLRSIVGSLDAAILESNYDETMLARGPYPARVKRRIRGPGGHLSNEEAAALLRDHASPRLRWVCLAHLSDVNNDPELALRVHRQHVGRRFPLRLAGRHGATEEMHV